MGPGRPIRIDAGAPHRGVGVLEPVMAERMTLAWRAMELNPRTVDRVELATNEPDERADPDSLWVIDHSLAEPGGALATLRIWSRTTTDASTRTSANETMTTVTAS